eukprot:scaffold79844_cov39-Prasinocladus_malaysianus.AAC.1
MHGHTHLIEHNPKGPHVALFVVRLVFAELRAQIEGRPQDGPAEVGVVAEGAGDAEVAQHDVTGLREEEIQSLDVTVDDLLAVQVVQGQQSLTMQGRLVSEHQGE